MSKRLPVTPAPGPLEAFARAFDDLFSKRNQHEGSSPRFTLERTLDWIPAC